MLPGEPVPIHGVARLAQLLADADDVKLNASDNDAVRAAALELGGDQPCVADHMCDDESEEPVVQCSPPAGQQQPEPKRDQSGRESPPHLPQDPQRAEQEFEGGLARVWVRATALRAP